jgi:histidinol-phosphate/aromatic aminotransferase/cobyric acid decarboxylase-like protein/adenosyl cobinamide kinase/adenosyl cobinamide phosphate guanylyltransferase
MSLVVVIGGTRSGKSGRAEARAAAGGRAVVYVATGDPSDPELAERVAVHRDRRDGRWRTVESVHLDEILEDVPDGATVLIDDLEGWLVDRMTAHRLWTDAAVAPLGEEDRAAHRSVVAEAETWWRRAARRGGDTIVVAGQTGWGPTPPSASTRRWLDLHGDVLQSLVATADEAELVVAGRPVPLTGSQPSVPDRLREHGDRQVPDGCLDLAVNVLAGPPAWLRERLAAGLDDLAAYPDPAPARSSAARRHGRPPGECLLLDGAAEGFWLLAHTLRPSLAACVHPSFTEGEAALRAEGVPVVRILRSPDDGWRLDPAIVPEEADLVLLGRPDNPTGVLDPEDVVASLCRPGRIVVVDEAFADFLPDASGLAGRRDLPGLVVLRSLTKMWGLAGLRTGYLLAEPGLVTRLDAARQPWSVNTLALLAVEACVTEEAEEERAGRAADVATKRDRLHAGLTEVAGVETWPAAANFLLVRTPLTDLRERLLADGLAVRRGDTFPGLDPTYVRITVRDAMSTDRLVAAVGRHLAEETTYAGS